MSNEINKELLEKVKQAKSAEELKALAKENGVELTDEQAAEVLAKLKSGELSDEELNAVAGGVVLNPNRIAYYLKHRENKVI